MKFVNLTNRTINVVDAHGNDRLVLKPSGVVVGVTTNHKVLETIYDDAGYMGDPRDAYEIVTYEYSGVNNIPNPVAGVMYVVSYAVLQALGGKRQDVVAPDTAPSSIIRDGAGQRVLGVQRFRKL